MKIGCSEFFALSLLCLLPVFTLYAGHRGNEWLPDHASVNLEYGRVTLFRFSDFHHFFIENDDSDFGQHFASFGAGLTGPLCIGRGAGTRDICFDGDFSLNYWRSECPETDSLQYRINSTHFKWAGGIDFLYFLEKLDLPIRFGFSAGNLRFKYPDTRYRNPFCCLIVQVEPRLILWRFAISVKAERGYDITSPNWKPKQSGINTNLKFSNHYQALFFKIGFVLE